jgi:hypothetical protein
MSKVRPAANVPMMMAAVRLSGPMMVILPLIQNVS